MQQQPQPIMQMQMPMQQPPMQQLQFQQAQFKPPPPPSPHMPLNQVPVQNAQIQQPLLQTTQTLLVQPPQPQLLVAGGLAAPSAPPAVGIASADPAVLGAGVTASLPSTLPDAGTPVASAALAALQQAQSAQLARVAQLQQVYAAAGDHASAALVGAYAAAGYDLSAYLEAAGLPGAAVANDFVHDPDRRFTGTVRSWNADGGFGFIVSPESRRIYNKDIFLHKSEIGHEPDLYKLRRRLEFKDGEPVTFLVEYDEKQKPRAKLVELVNYKKEEETPPPPPEPEEEEPPPPPKKRRRRAD